MLNKEWEELKFEVEKQISIICESQTNKKLVADTLVDNLHMKLESINIELFVSEIDSKLRREKAIWDMAMYLWAYEGKFSFGINIICFLLILNGHDLYDERKKYITTFEDLESVSIARKCEFLAHHGFKIFDEAKNKTIKKFRKMRNDIAHYKLIIGDNGEIKTYNGKTKNWEEIPLRPVKNELTVFASDLLMILFRRLP